MSFVSSAPDTKARISALEHACHHCPLVLFAFLTDADAATLACACSALSTICKRSYDIKRELPIRCVLARLYPCVVRKVLFDGQNDQLRWVPKLPSTVTSMSVNEVYDGWRGTDLPRSLTHFSFVDTFDSTLFFSISTAENWPPGLTSLQLEAFNINSQLPPLPSTLRAFGSRGHRVGGGCLPDSLTALRLDIANDELWCRLPHLTTLEVWLSSETTAEHLAHLPASLIHLTLVCRDDVHKSFRTGNADTIKLPSGLRYLRLDSVPYRAFRDLPSSLEHLVVNTVVEVADPIDFWGFGGPIRHASLQTLELPTGFNFPLDAGHLPRLRELSLAAGFSQPLNDLPASLRKLKVRFSNVKQPLDSLPAGLTELDLRFSRFNHPVDRLPRNLLSLTLSRDFDHPLDALPIGLTHLDLNDAYRFSHVLDDLPETLQVLIMPFRFPRPLQRLPCSLRALRFNPGCLFNHPLPPLPDSLSVLNLGSSFAQSLRRLPRGLTELKLDHMFNHPLPLVKPEPALMSNEDQGQPPSTRSSAAPDVDNQESKAETMTYPVALRSLDLGHDFNQPLLLPPSLTRLSIDPHGVFNQPLPLSSLPEALTYLSLPKRYKWNDMDAAQEQRPFLLIKNTKF